AGLAGLVSWLMIQTILSTGVVAMLKGIDAGEVNAAFGKINNQFIGILSGIIGSTCYNRFKNTKLPDALAFFSGKRSVAIVTALASLVACLVLFFVWPVVYSALVAFGEAILGLGAVGAGIYGFFNRLLIPVGLHHALNSVFWFDVAGVNDLGNFWAGTGTLGVTGQYMTGFFPVMMFGLPAAALAMYHTAKPGKKKVAYGLLLAAAVCSFFTGVTEPLEFAFMFLAPGLYLIHALLTGISLAICALLPVRAGFNFSAGFVDWFLSFKAPMAVNPLFIIPIGLIYGVIYYVVFRFAIVKFNFKTPGREDDDDIDENQVTLANNDYTQVASIILEGLGGKGNIKSVDNCITRLRLEINDYTLVNEKKIKSAGVAGVIRPGKTSVQVIVGTQVQFVADEFKKLCQ
ncbi:PTS transporter subunit EIIC, partial [Hungatella hathewayi]